jgi:hypothetical protein
MILSNVTILDAVERKALSIEPLAGADPSAAPFNASAVDLRLGTEIAIPMAAPAALDLRRKGISSFLDQHCVLYEAIYHRRMFAQCSSNLADLCKRSFSVTDLEERRQSLRFPTSPATMASTPAKSIQFAFRVGAVAAERQLERMRLLLKWKPLTPLRCRSSFTSAPRHDSP